jgi:two-component system, NtrC family, nitrogen regulation sensor histidine kinase NtrY
VRSLRFRLVLGISLIAVVPLAIAIVLLTDRIESLVRAQASDRLASALGAIQSRLRSDERRAAEKLRILARDPELKRLYLVRTGEGRELSGYLAERRFLLDYDFLRIADASGAVVADAADAPPAAGEARPALRPAAASRPPRQVEIRSLEGDEGLALVVSQPIPYRNENVGRLEGGFALDAGFLRRLREQSGLELALQDAQGRLAAATLPPDTAHVRGAGQRAAVPLALGDPPYPSLVGIASTAQADRAIASLQLASVALGLAALGIAIALGLLWSSQVSNPVERLAAASARLARGDWDEPVTLRGVRELETLGAALDRMRLDLQSYRDRLVTSERQAAWSQMARKVAHEIKNPLTPIAISVADLRRSYEQGRPDFAQILDQAVRTIGDEVESMKRLLQEFADFARFPAPRIAPCRWSELAADLETLYGREVTAGRLAVSAGGRDLTFPADAGQIRQALVNLVQNGLDAAGPEGRVTLAAQGAPDSAVLITVHDSGPGLSPEQERNLFAPGFTTKPHGSGLGLTIVQRIVSDHGGTIAAESGSDGTTFRIRLPRAKEE